MAVREKKFDAAEWTALVGSSPGFGLVQTWEYGKAKTETGSWLQRHLLIEDAGRPVAAAQVMLRNLPLVRGGLAWINRGPIILNESQAGPDLLVGALGALVRHWVQKRGYYLRLAPPWTDGAYSLQSRETGLMPAGRMGWASARLDLAASLELLRAGLRKNWRSALISAEKGGVETRTGEHEFGSFLGGYRTFLLERGFTTPVTPDFLVVLQRLLPENRKLRAFTAGAEDAPIAGVLISHQGNTAEYLSAFRNAAGNRRNAGQLLLWRAVCDAREAGMRWFDMGGMDPANTVPGILKFKEGAGAQPYRLAEEMEAAAGWAARFVRWKVRRTL